MCLGDAPRGGRRPAAIFLRGRVRCAVLGGRPRTRAAGRVGKALRGTRSATQTSTRHRQAGGRVPCRPPAAALLQPGDLVLAIDGKVVDRFREVERAVQRPQVKVSVWRDGAEKTL